MRDGSPGPVVPIEFWTRLDDGRVRCDLCPHETLSDGAPPHAFPDAAESLGCKSVAFTYNDPVIFHEYAIDVAQACRARGIKAIAVTAGEVNPAPRAEFYRHMDTANVDLKGFTEAFYRDVCGGHLQPVLDTLEYVANEDEAGRGVLDAGVPPRPHGPV